MYPNFALLHQDIAAGLIRYRFNRVSGAEIFAKTYKPPYSGTQFPWESGFTGQNVCPKGVGTCTREIHISGDIAYAVCSQPVGTRTSHCPVTVSGLHCGSTGV